MNQNATTNPMNKPQPDSIKLANQLSTHKIILPVKNLSVTNLL